MPRNWEQREKKLDKRRNGMRVSGRSAFVIQESNRKRDQKKIEEARKGKFDATLSM